MSGKGEKGRFYHHFQIEDVLKFHSGQLSKATTPNGAKVFLQEITVDSPLPRDFPDMLRNSQHLNIAPILDVIVGKGKILLVHPPFSGDPLPMIVDEEKPLKPLEALDIFYKMLRTMLDLGRLPVPFYTSLDPKNIFMSKGEPFLLFYGTRKFEQYETIEKWRTLLYFLLTGTQAEKEAVRKKRLTSMQKLPPEIRKLALDCMDRNVTPYEVLNRAKNILESMTKETKKKKPATRKLYLMIAAAASLVVIAFIGYQSAYSDELKRFIGADQGTVPMNPFEASLNQTEQSTVTFDSEIGSVYHSPKLVEGPTRISGEFQLDELKSFSAELFGKGKHYSYGVKLTNEGEFVVYQWVKDKYYPLVESGNAFRAEPKKNYIVELLYVPNEPLRVSITEKGTTNKWIAVGAVPMDWVFRVDFLGRKGTVLQDPTVERIPGDVKALSAWMNNEAWELVSGHGVVGEDGFILMKNSKAHITDFRSSNFTFNQEGEGKDGPFRLELESVEGERFHFDWVKENVFRLYQLDQSNGQESQQIIPWKWIPNEKTNVSIISDNELAIEINQGENSERVSYSPTDEAPISPRSMSIISFNDLKLYSK